jgi:hypothetical protein
MTIMLQTQKQKETPQNTLRINQRKRQTPRIQHINRQRRRRLYYGYTWQYKGCPTLKKYKNIMLFVDHKTKLVYPSFQETKTGKEACRSKRDYKTFAKHYKVDIERYQIDNGAFHEAKFHKEIDSKARH